MISNSEFVCGAPMPHMFQFRTARFCHESFAVSAPKAEASKVSTVEFGCGSEIPQDPISFTNFPHHFDARDDGRFDTSIDFAQSDTFRCLEAAKSKGYVDPTDYPLILEEAAKLYSQLQ